MDKPGYVIPGEDLVLTYIPDKANWGECVWYREPDSSTQRLCAYDKGDDGSVTLDECVGPEGEGFGDNFQYTSTEPTECIITVKGVSHV